MKKKHADNGAWLQRNAVYRGVLGILRASLWGERFTEADEAVFEELKRHTVESLAAPVLSSLSLAPELREKWKKSVLQQIAIGTHYRYAQSVLPVEVPYVILKGTCAAMYYPHPEYRAMGDIDIMTDRGDFDTAVRQLGEGGYTVVERKEREIVLRKNGIHVEVHRYFASLNDAEHSRHFDDLIISGISPSHVLPDMVNGLVLLEHISQHLEHGLGLRQIIDWMMFADKCLSDARWPEFEPLAKNIGMEKLAVAASRMCEMYLGLPERKWCREADEAVCARLMEYVMGCGNFGNKWTEVSDTGKKVLSYARGLGAAFRYFQEHGLENWEAAKKHPFLRHFAWLHQARLFISKGITQKGSLGMLREEYREARQRNRLFDSLGVKQKSKGIIVYRNGEYVRE